MEIPSTFVKKGFVGVLLEVSPSRGSSRERYQTFLKNRKRYEEIAFSSSLISLFLFYWDKPSQRLRQLKRAASKIYGGDPSDYNFLDNVDLYWVPVSRLVLLKVLRSPRDVDYLVTVPKMERLGKVFYPVSN